MFTMLMILHDDDDDNDDDDQIQQSNFKMMIKMMMMITMMTIPCFTFYTSKPTVKTCFQINTTNLKKRKTN